MRSKLLLKLTTQVAAVMFRIISLNSYALNNTSNQNYLLRNMLMRQKLILPAKLEKGKQDHTLLIYLIKMKVIKI